MNVTGSAGVRTTGRLLSCAVVGLLAACGSVLEPSGDLADALVVELPGYVAAAPGPIRLTLCNPLPSGTGPIPPSFGRSRRAGHRVL